MKLNGTPEKKEKSTSMQKNVLNSLKKKCKELMAKAYVPNAGLLALTLKNT